MPDPSRPYDQATHSRRRKIIASALNGKGGAAAGRRIELTGSMVVGRENADITIEDSEISMRHAEVRATEDSVEIEDLGSTNGTFVNGDRISGARPLVAGDVVRMGQSELEFEVEREAGSGTVVAASPPPRGTSISESPAQPPAAEDDTVQDAAVTGTAAGAPPSVESWSPAPTGAGAGGPSAPPAGAYQPPPAAGGYSPPQQGGYGAQQGYGTQQGQGYGGSGHPTQGGYGSGGYGASSAGKSSKGPLIAALLIGLLLVGGFLAYWFLLRSTDEDKVRDVVTEFGETIDDPAVCDLLTQRFIEEATGATGGDATEACRSDVEANPGDPAEIQINSVEIEGDTATVEAEAEGNPGTFHLVKQDGEWLIDDTEEG